MSPTNMDSLTGTSPTQANAPYLERRQGITPQPHLPHNDVVTELNAIVWVLILFAFAFLALRIYCKVSRHRGLWWDDYVLVVSWCSVLASGALITTSSSYGFGKHIYDMQTETFPYLLLTLNLSGVFSTLSACWSKTSFAITLLRISEGRIKKFVWFCIITINIVMTLATILMWVQCTPVKRAWHPWLEGGVCWNKWVIIIYNSFTSAYSGLADIALATIPWKIVKRHTMNYKEKIGMLVAMSMGIFAGLTSLAKTATFPAMADSDMINTVPLIILGVAECAVTIMAASIPVLRALLRSSPSSGADVLTPNLPATHTVGSSPHWRDQEQDAWEKQFGKYSAGGSAGRTRITRLESMSTKSPADTTTPEDSWKY